MSSVTLDLSLSLSLSLSRSFIAFLKYVVGSTLEMWFSQVTLFLPLLFLQPLSLSLLFSSIRLELSTQILYSEREREKERARW